MQYSDSYFLNKLNRLHETSLKISRLINAPGSDIEDFISTIRFNSELSARIIEIANRSYSGLTGEIESISRAVRMLGIGQLHYIVNCLQDSETRAYKQHLKQNKVDLENIEIPTEIRQAG